MAEKETIPSDIKSSEVALRTGLPVLYMNFSPAVYFAG